MAVALRPSPIDVAPRPVIGAASGDARFGLVTATRVVTLLDTVAAGSAMGRPGGYGRGLAGFGAYPCLSGRSDLQPHLSAADAAPTAKWPRPSTVRVCRNDAAHVSARHRPASPVISGSTFSPDPGVSWSGPTFVDGRDRLPI